MRNLTTLKEAKLTELFEEVNKRARSFETTLIQIELDIEKIMEEWYLVSYAVGTCDQWKAEEAVETMFGKLQDLLGKISREKDLLK